MRSRSALPDGFKPSTGWLVFLLGILILLFLPAGASAAECTNTWTGPAEGSWGTSANWSAGHVPKSTEVVCIGSGKTVNITTGTNQAAAVQGEGTLTIEKSSLELTSGSEASNLANLTLYLTATLKGAGTLRISNSLAWKKESTMAGSGSTVILPGATAMTSMELFAKLQRRLVNEGSFTMSSGTLQLSEGGEVENTGTFNANTAATEGITGSKTFVNSGTFQRTTTGSTGLRPPMKNAGTVTAQKGTLAFLGGGSSSASNEWTASEGEINFGGGSFSLTSGTTLAGAMSISGKTTSVSVEGVAAGSAKVEIKKEATLTIPSGTLTLSTLTMSGYRGVVSGAGTLKISNNLAWSNESTMSGSGSTILLPGAMATTSMELTGTIQKRTFVNEGTFTMSTGTVEVSESGRFENLGAFNANTTASKALSGNSAFANLGTFRRTISGATKVEVPFENAGAVTAAAGLLNFTGGGSSISPDEWNASGGEFNFTGGSYTLLGATTLVGPVVIAGKATSVAVAGGSGASAQVTVREEATLNLLAGTLTLGTLTMSAYRGTVTGAGTLRISNKFAWKNESTMSGTGSTILLPGATGSTTMELAGSLKQRTFVNEGTFTMSTGTIEESEGAALRNFGTFNANTSSAKAITGTKTTLFNGGTFQKTAGATTTEVEPDFENAGVIHESSGQMKILHPVAVRQSNQFGKRCQSGDPVECATGNFSESQTDFAIGGLGVGLVLTRTYSAQAAATATSPGAFGYGFSGSFGDHLSVEESGAKATLTKGDGSTIPFTRVSGSVYAGPAWSQETLSGSPEAGYSFSALDQTQFRFSGAGRLESVVDRNGNESTLSYDEAGRLKAVTDPAGRQLNFAYNTGGQVESVADTMGHLVKYAYEGGNLTSVTMPGEASPRWQFKYDAAHRITQVTDGRGGKTTNEYDSSNRVISQTDPAGRTLTFKYEAFHTTITNKATGAVTDEWFTSYNEPFSVTRGYGTAAATTDTFAYNEFGQLTRRTDGNGHTTTYGYDEAGNRTSERDPLGHETKWTYNATHDLTSITLPGGEAATIKRDSYGNLESISRPAPGEATQTTSFAHDEHGQLTSVTDPLERTWSFGYDSFGNRTAETDPLGNETTLAYDEGSRLVSIVTPRGNVEGAEPTKYETTIERDAQGLPLKVTDPLGHVTEYAYDGNGNLASLTDAKGQMTKYTYNGDDERTKVEKPNGATLETGYDAAGFVTSQTNGLGKTTTYVRNVLGQPVEVIDPLGRKTLEEFDAADNLVALVDPAERKTSYTYDAADRLTGVGYSEEATPDAAFKYDADGNLVAMTDGSGESSFAYDQLGRLTRSEDGHGDVVEYSYDLGNQQTGIVYPNGKGVSRSYDGAGRLESITDWLGGTTTFGYDADSNLTGISFPAESGNSDEYAYDRASRMSEAKFKKGSETLASLSYLRDPLGQVEEEARNGLPGPESVNYGYDKDNRLIEAGTASFEYDAADNLTKGIGSTNTYDAASQLEAGTGVTYSYDKLGERVKTSPSGGPATSYGYNQAGNLTSINRAEEGEVAGIAESFAYDGTGLLVSKTSGLTTKHFAWDSSEALPLLLDDEDNSYVYGPNDLLIEQVSSAEEPTYLHHDQLGSTRMLTDAGGETSATFSYAPYGGLEGRTGTATTRFGFADQYTDPETGLQYLRARFYDPETGQFLTRDPIDALTGQPYSYGLDNPLTQADPSGLFAIAGALGCLAGPEAAAVCAGIGTTAACAAISPCRNAAEEAANEVAHLFEGEDSSDESSSQDAEPCGKEIGDAKQALDLADEFVQKLLLATGGGPPQGSRGRALLAAILIIIDAIRHSG